MHNNRRFDFYHWLGNVVAEHSTPLIISVIAITLALIFPLILMPPKETASDNPTGSEVVRLKEQIDDTFPSEIHVIPLIIEAKDGDIFTQKALYELWQNQENLKQSDLSSFLYWRYNSAAQKEIQGVYSVADFVNDALIFQSNGAIDLSQASDQQVKQAVDTILENPSNSELYDRISTKSTKTEHGWISPAFMFIVLADADAVKTDYPASVGKEYSDEIALQHYSREALYILRGDELHYEIWGVNIDLDLEIMDEGRYSIPMTGIAMGLIILLLFVIFRSPMITLATTAGLIMIVIWLMGFSNLIGLKDSRVLDLIVPIAIVVLGVDYAIQALFRYREERDKGQLPKQALNKSTYGVGRALMLAMLTTVIAFSSNAASGIESMVGFAIAASFAIVASYIILGLFVPALIMRYHTWKGDTKFENRASLNRKSSLNDGLGNLVAWVSTKWRIVMPLILLLTALSIWGWIYVETKIEVQDAFSTQSDLVIGVEKYEEHIPPTVGEPAYIYIEGDLTQLESLVSMKNLVTNMNDNQHIARSISTGEPNANVLLFELLGAVIDEEYTRKAIYSESGITITDVDGDRIPDTPAQLEAVYDFITVNGILQSEESIYYRPRLIAESFAHRINNTDKQATILWIGIPGTQNSNIVEESATELLADMDIAMSDMAGITTYGLTGNAYVRVEQFDAITASLSKSLIIAAALVILLLIVVFRSLPYAILTTLPVLLVACWLYGFMYLMGYHLNIMTAMIAALSIGIGIDFSIHFAERFRQEYARRLGKLEAIRETARTTGFALFSTAVTTIVGFVVITFAPMPMFATFGVLTAMMIGLSLLASLFVLPGLLLLFTRRSNSS